MSTFTTAGPPALSVRFAAGRLSVRAATDDDSAHSMTIDVRPGNPGTSADVDYAAATVVEQRGDTIVVIAPPARGWFGRQARLDISAVTPPQAAVDIDVRSADVHLTGELGRVAIHAASGDISIDRVAALSVRTASGDVSCTSVAGDASITTASGDARLHTIDGSAQLSTASGDVSADDVGGDIRARSASGDIVLGRLGGSATVRTASGDVRIGSIGRGELDVDSKSGDIEIGIRSGSAAWLDVTSISGSVSSSLEPADTPGDDADRVIVHARSLSGDVRVRRAAEVSGGPR